MRMNTPFAAFYQNYQLTDGSQSPAGDGINNWGLVNAPTIVAGKNSANAVTFDKPMGITPGTESFQNAYFNPNQPTSRVHDWNLTAEKEIMRDTVLRVAYVGNKATYQDSYDDNNQMMPAYVWLMTQKLRFLAALPVTTRRARFPRVPTATSRSTTRTAGAGRTASRPNSNAATPKASASSSCTCT